MRTPKDSPFSPGSDSVPQIWAGRTDQLSDFRDVVTPRRLAGIPERGRIILGEPGSGKSALVAKIAHEVKDHHGWATNQIRVELGGNPLARLATELLDLARAAGLPHARDERIGHILDRVETISMAGVSLTTRARNHDTDSILAVSSLLIEIGRAARDRGDTLVLVHIDEVQNITDDAVRSALLIALGDALSHEDEIRLPGGEVASAALPLAVYLTGLPEFLTMAGSRSGATFVRRFDTEILEGISDADLITALQPFVTDGWRISGADGHVHDITMTQEAQKRIVELSVGEPFLFQLAGEGAWFAADDDVITRAHVDAGWDRARRQAERHVTRMLERLPAKEHEFLETMAALEPSERTATRIAHALGHDSATHIGSTARRLDLDRGLIARGKPYTFRNKAVQAYLTTNWPELH